ncbi:MAG: hypothetical protein HYU27_03380 [Acidobacteria bacterium]|nr:hypothetical protein [Acidobacteriota bacterium]
MRRNMLVLVTAMALLMAAAPAPAHHAFSAEFDGTKQVNLRGTIARMDWINPHAWLHIDVKETNGAVTRWMIELGPPNSLIKRGWSKKSVPAGIEVLVLGYQAKDGAKRANGRDITMPDGKKLFHKAIAHVINVTYDLSSLHQNIKGVRNLIRRVSGLIR